MAAYHRRASSYSSSSGLRHGGGRTSYSSGGSSGRLNPRLEVTIKPMRKRYRGEAADLSSDTGDLKEMSKLEMRLKSMMVEVRTSQEIRTFAEALEGDLDGHGPFINGMLLECIKNIPHKAPIYAWYTLYKNLHSGKYRSEIEDILRQVFCRIAGVDFDDIYCMALLFYPSNTFVVHSSLEHIAFDHRRLEIEDELKLGRPFSIFVRSLQNGMYHSILWGVTVQLLPYDAGVLSAKNVFHVLSGILSIAQESPRIVSERMVNSFDEIYGIERGFAKVCIVQHMNVLLALSYVLPAQISDDDIKESLESVLTSCEKITDLRRKEPISALEKMKNDEKGAAESDDFATLVETVRQLLVAKTETVDRINGASMFKDLRLGTQEGSGEDTKTGEGSDVEPQSSASSSSSSLVEYELKVRREGVSLPSSCLHVHPLQYHQRLFPKRPYRGRKRRGKQGGGGRGDEDDDGEKMELDRKNDGPEKTATASSMADKEGGKAAAGGGGKEGSKGEGREGNGHRDSGSGDGKATTKKTIVTTKSERILARLHLNEVVDLLQGSHKICAERLVSLQLGGIPLKHLIIEVIFNIVIGMPKPKQDLVWVVSLLYDVLKLDSKLVPLFALGAHSIFIRADRLDVDAIDRFTQFFPLQMSNLGYKFTWKHWSKAVGKPPTDPQRVFVTEILKRCVRLERRGIDSIPEELDPILPKCPPRTYYLFDDKKYDNYGDDGGKTRNAPKAKKQKDGSFSPTSEKASSKATGGSKGEEGGDMMEEEQDISENDDEKGMEKKENPDDSSEEDKMKGGARMESDGDDDDDAKRKRKAPSLRDLADDLMDFLDTQREDGAIEMWMEKHIYEEKCFEEFKEKPEQFIVPCLLETSRKSITHVVSSFSKYRTLIRGVIKSDQHQRHIGILQLVADFHRDDESRLVTVIQKFLQHAILMPSQVVDWALGGGGAADVPQKFVKYEIVKQTVIGAVQRTRNAANKNLGVDDMGKQHAGVHDLAKRQEKDLFIRVYRRISELYLRSEEEEGEGIRQYVQRNLLGRVREFGRYFLAEIQPYMERIEEKVIRQAPDAIKDEFEKLKNLSRAFHSTTGKMVQESNAAE
eukprot:jgi/Bigna1/88985/estExt_fgenesh1_pg.C_410131